MLHRSFRNRSCRWKWGMVICYFFDNISDSAGLQTSSVVYCVLPKAKEVTHMAKITIKELYYGDKYAVISEAIRSFPPPVKQGEPRNPTAIHRRFKLILERSGCKNIRFHDLRLLRKPTRIWIPTVKAKNERRCLSFLLRWSRWQDSELKRAVKCNGYAQFCFSARSGKRMRLRSSNR